MGITLDCREPRVSEIWDRFYNGPNAGLIDVELARKEMPWLIGEGASIVLSGPTANVASNTQR